CLKPGHRKQHLFSFPTLALFTVEVPQQLYVAEYGSNVTMECRFPVNGSLNLGLLSVVWEQKRQGQLESRDVYTLRNGETLLSSQHRDYMGRAALLHNELKLGRAILQITSVKITDAGSYLCLIDYQGADYKYITLEVKGQKWNEDKLAFICQSEGFPLAEVFWQNEKNFSLSGSANTTYTLTADGLYNVTSILIISQNMNENYSCVFWNKELNENTSFIYFACFLSHNFTFPVCLFVCFLFVCSVLFFFDSFNEYTVWWTKVPDLIYHRHVCDSTGPSLCINNLPKDKIIHELPC
uniref:Ig-like domain-containing protein n=1 Tax=Pavo cristatus TaxID=9049 RepID=A0A8C9LCS4_PAVCR